MSRLGKRPVAVPKEVKIEQKGGIIYVQGPKGKLERKLSGRLIIEIKDNELTVKRNVDTKEDRALHGLYRALIFNMIKGVSEGYKKELEIQGVGFRAQVQGKTLNLQVGYSHPVNFPIPDDVKIEAPKQNLIVISGIDKEKVGEIAAEIRAVRPPEPYKGKGIRYAGEYIKRKVGKAQATTK
ncbi:MAG: 50S ribosomal protein L6 [Candidatus Omnitrophota bacterium]|nr:MAG: 50S ribosomal protein L6 [Candidatus Omnitrophota bacterium]